MKLVEQQMAPDFEAPDQFGKVHTLAEFRGKWLLLYFYPKDHTPGCTVEACQFRDYFEELKGKIEVVGVNADRSETHRSFAEKHRLPFLLLSDPSKKMIQSYDAKWLFFTRRISYLIAPDGKIVKIYPSVNPRTHAEEVLKDYHYFSEK